MSKILFFDIDGTIVNHNVGLDHPSPLFIKTIKQLQANGHQCFISSGRCYGYITEDIKSIGFDGYILNNGGNIQYHNETLFPISFPIKKVLDIIQLCSKTHSQYSLCDTHHSYCPETFKEQIDYLVFYSVPRHEIIHDYDLKSLQIIKIEVNCPNEQACVPFRALFDEGYEVVEYKGYNHFEIMMPGVSKANAMLHFAEHVKMDLKDTIAFGDGDNDYDMISLVGYGVAMGNAVESLKEVANAVCEPCQEDGITKELIRIGLVDESILR